MLENVVSVNCISVKSFAENIAEAVQRNAKINITFRSCKDYYPLLILFYKKLQQKGKLEIPYGSLTLEHEMHHADADDGSYGAAGGVGSQVEPFAGTIGGAVSLNEL